MAKPAQTIKLFYCYAHEDQMFRDELGKHLGALRRSGQIIECYDRKIRAGAEWAKEIGAQITFPCIILLLVSADFISSDYCYNIELQNAFELHSTGKAHVIPVILRYVDYQETPLARLQILPIEGEPIGSSYWSSQDEAFYNVAQGIRNVVNVLQEKAEDISFSHFDNTLRPSYVLNQDRLVSPSLDEIHATLQQLENTTITWAKRYKLDEIHATLQQLENATTVWSKVYKR